VSQEESPDLRAFLESGRKQLEQASAEYGRALLPEEYWWLGVGLAAVTLAELGDKPYAAGRLEQLIERAGYKGVRGDWFQRFTEELAELDAEGLLYPIWQRNAEGTWVETGAQVHAGFGPQDGYFLALGHIAVALAVLRDDAALIGQVAQAVGEIVTSGLEPGHEALILKALQPEE
jgi:hypothetical protein